MRIGTATGENGSASSVGPEVLARLPIQLPIGFCCPGKGLAPLAALVNRLRRLLPFEISGNAADRLMSIGPSAAPDPMSVTSGSALADCPLVTAPSVLPSWFAGATSSGAALLAELACGRASAAEDGRGWGLA